MSASTELSVEEIHAIRKCTPHPLNQKVLGGKWRNNRGEILLCSSQVSRTHCPLEMHPFNTVDSLMRSEIGHIKRELQCSWPQGNFGIQKVYLTCLRAVPSNYGPPVLAPPAPTPRHSDVPLRFPFSTSNKPQATDSEMSACSVPCIVPVHSLLMRTCYTVMSNCCSPHNVYSEWPTWA